MLLSEQFTWKKLKCVLKNIHSINTANNTWKKKSWASWGIDLCGFISTSLYALYLPSKYRNVKKNF